MPTTNILNYLKGISKETIRKLSGYFKVSQEAFNRSHKPINGVNRPFRANLMNTKKDLGNVVIGFNHRIFIFLDQTHGYYKNHKTYYNL